MFMAAAVAAAPVNLGIKTTVLLPATVVTDIPVLLPERVFTTEVAEVDIEAVSRVKTAAVVLVAGATLVIPVLTVSVVAAAAEKGAAAESSSCGIG